MDLSTTSRQGEIFVQNFYSWELGIPAVSRSVTWCLVDALLPHNNPLPSQINPLLYYNARDNIILHDNISLRDIIIFQAVLAIF